MLAFPNLERAEDSELYRGLRPAILPLPNRFDQPLPSAPLKRLLSVLHDAPFRTLMSRSLRPFGGALLLVAAVQLVTVSPVAATGSITEYPLPANGGWCSCPASIALGADGNLWFTETGGALGYGAIGNISTSGVITQFRLRTYDSIPVGIAPGPAGSQALWFTEQNSNRIGQITTAGVISEFPLTLSGSQPRGIALGPDGNLWFTQSLASTTSTTCSHHKCSTTTSTTTGYIGRITTSGSVTEFAVPYAYSRPFWITSGPDGNLWFTDEGTNSVGKITTTGTVTEFALGTAGSGPHGIAAGPDGNLWATEEQGNNVARILTSTGTISEYAAPGAPAGIVAGPDNNLWFTQVGTSTSPSGVGIMNTSGAQLMSYSLTGSPDPQGITVGPAADGRIWFTEEFGGTNGAIGVITVL
jgi:streptogramin lyase